jgi:hypothetical protein
MKVYFAAAISKRDELGREFAAIMKAITNLGHELLLAYDVMHDDVERILNQTTEETHVHYVKWQKTIQKADVAVVEVSFPSTVHIGVEVGALIERSKPVICLYAKGHNPVFTSEFHSSRLIKLEYSIETIEDVLRWGFEEVEGMLNRRFTFFITPEIDAYLGKMSGKKGASRSEYIRELIEKEMRKKRK